QLTEFVRNIARDILKVDSTLDLPENLLLKAQLRKRFAHEVNWGVIS
ncbi:MAG: hypothetical protein GX619_03025, partial [Bacteroidales bacterium]|nr:hypothetical protein [Bacteroidales bacterium]